MADYNTFNSRLKSLRFYAIKRQFGKGTNVIQDGGWHYSYMAGGDAKRVRDKVNLFAEKNLVELAGSVEEVADKIANQKDLYNRSEVKNYYKQKIVDISANKPKHLDEWLEKYPLFIYKEKK